MTNSCRGSPAFLYFVIWDFLRHSSFVIRHFMVSFCNRWIGHEKRKIPADSDLHLPIAVQSLVHICPSTRDRALSAGVGGTSRLCVAVFSCERAQSAQVRPHRS